jgi:hypothetical protein
VLPEPCVLSLTPPADLLQALSAALDSLRVGWYVFGAQAVLQWGRPRFTEDIDVTVLAGAVTTAQLVARLRQHGFELRIEGTPAFVDQTRVLPLTFSDSGWALDLVLGGPGLEEHFLERSIPTEVTPGLHVRVICPEDLIVTKVLAGRPKDLDDARSVVQARGDALDRDGVRRTLAMLEEALGVSDLVPVFERLDDAAV